MQALTIWPSANDCCHSCAMPQLCSESYSCNDFVRYSKRRIGFDFCSTSAYSSCNIRSFRPRNCKLKRGAFHFNHSKVHTLSKQKNVATSSSVWALEETDVAEEDDLSSKDMKSSTDHVKNRKDEEFVSIQLDVVNGEDDDGSKGEFDDDGGEVGNVTRAKIDVRALALSLHSAKSAYDVEEVLKERGNNIPLQVYSTMIRGFGKDGKLESAMALFEWLKRKSKEIDSPIKLNLYIYNNLLGAMKQSKSFDVVEQIMNDMAMEEGLDPNVVTYNTLMSIYIEQGREAEAIKLSEEMPSKGLSPSPATLSTVLSAYRRMEDGFGALAFYVQMKENYERGEIGQRNTEEEGEDWEWDYEFAKLENFTVRICYQVMRRALAQSDKSSTCVMKLLHEMDKVGLKLGCAEYERLVWACTREEHCVVAKELYTRIREMEAETISLSVCNHIIWLMGKAKKWWAALEIYEDLLDKGPKPNNMSYELIVSHFNILLSAARKRGIWRWGVRLLNKMEEKGLKPGSREWNSVLVACSKASETSAAIEIFKRMVEQGEKPTIISYGALLSALEKGKLYEEALQVWKHMVKVGVEPNLYAYTIMASIYAGQGKYDILDSIIREMVIVGIEPTVVTFNAIISGCTRNDDQGSVAYEWFQRMKSQKVTPNEVTYETLVEALAKVGKPRLVYELYLRAQNEGLALSAKAYDAVIRSSQEYGASIDVDSLGPRPLEKKMKNKVQIRKNLTEFCKLASVPRRSKPFDREEIYKTHGEEIEK